MILFKWHAGLMAAGFLSFSSAVLVAATQRRKTWWLRALTIAAAVVTPILGLLQFKIRDRTGRLPATRRLCGRFSTGAALVTILFGLCLAGYL